MTRPYTHLTKVLECDSSTVRRVTTTEKALLILEDFLPDLVLMSTSYSPHKTIVVLEKVRKVMSSTHFIPLIFVVDWSQRLQRLIGVSWGDRIGILHNKSSAQEIIALMDRFIQNDG